LTLLHSFPTRRSSDLLVSLVTASGEIKPTTYTNVTAQGFGRIIEILVKEGDHVKKGDRLLLQENVQANADVQAQSAASNSAESGDRKSTRLNSSHVSI